MKRFLNWKTLRPDAVAGLTVAMVAIPQALAYASIANVNPIYGIYTAIITAIVGALVGSASFLVTGPTNATALVTLSVLAGFGGGAHYLESVFALAVLAGVIKLLFGALRLGNITRYLSNSVLTGFLTALGLLIALEQLGSLLGLALPKGQGAVAILSAVGRSLGEVNLPTMLTALTAMSVMLAAQRLNKRLPAALLAILAAGLLVQFTGWKALGVRLVGDMGLPASPALAFHIPQVNLAEATQLLSPALAVALFSMVETMSIAKAMSKPGGPALDLNREFMGQGLAGLVGGLTQCIPSSNSPSRSAVLVRAGGKTRMAGLLSGVFVWLCLVLALGLISAIPMPALAAVVVISALGLIDLAQVRLTWKAHWSSRLALATTFLAALLFPLEYAIYIGAGLSIGLYLYDSSRLKVTLIELNRDGSVVERPLADLARHPTEMAVVNVEGALYFGASSALEQALQDCLAAGVKTLVLRLRHSHSLASTGAMMLRWVVCSFQSAGGRVFISGVDEAMSATLNAAGVSRLVGVEHIYPANEVLFAATRRACDCAAQEAAREKN